MFGSKAKNGFLAFLYFSFLIVNMVFVVRTFVFFKDIKPDTVFEYPMSLAINRIIAIQTHVFVEIFNYSFYFLVQMRSIIIFSVCGLIYMNVLCK